ncbi:MAG: right-handed parallel beta-helix repeat-containing protein [Candidatus Binatia bacterium]
MQRILVPVAFAMMLAAPAPSTAASRACGDDVDGHGRAVPCSCGDVLVSSRTLSEADPVTRGPCEGTALLVHIARGRGPATLSLGGRTLAGTGRGAGIHLVDRTGDVAVRGPGVVRGFDTGIMARGGLSQLTDVVVTDNRGDGVRLGGTSYVIRGCEARANAGRGFALSGWGYRVDGNRALENGRDGFALAGHGATIGDNASAANGGTGIAVAGHEHAIVRSAVTGNARDGLRVRGARTAIVDTASGANSGSGLHAATHDAMVTATTVHDNAGPGVRWRGARRQVGPHTSAGGAPLATRARQP